MLLLSHTSITSRFKPMHHHHRHHHHDHHRRHHHHHHHHHHHQQQQQQQHHHHHHHHHQYCHSTKIKNPRWTNKKPKKRKVKFLCNWQKFHEKANFLQKKTQLLDINSFSKFKSRSGAVHKVRHAPLGGKIHSFITEIYIAPIQGYYSEALPTLARLKRRVLRLE